MTSRENQELVSKFAGGQVLFCATIDVIDLYNFGVGQLTKSFVKSLKILQTLDKL